MTRFFAVLVLLTLTALRANAKAAFQSSEHMIATSQVIALVQIQKVEPTSTKGTLWTYRQRATARIERVLKGHLRGQIALYGEEDFICARCRWSEGRALVFLRRDGDLWTGNNWHLGARPIKNDSVEWMDGNGIFGLKFQPLAKVLKTVEKTIVAQSKAPKWTLAYLKSSTSTWHIYQTGTGEKKQSFSRAELENWLRNLPLGSQIAYDTSCTGSNPDAATLDELASLCLWRGLSWTVNPAG